MSKNQDYINWSSEGLKKAAQTLQAEIDTKYGESVNNWLKKHGGKNKIPGVYRFLKNCQNTNGTIENIVSVGTIFIIAEHLTNPETNKKFTGLEFFAMCLGYKTKQTNTQLIVENVTKT